MLEKTNARYLTSEQIWPAPAIAEPIGLIAMDVSFISATLVLPAVLRCCSRARPRLACELVVLVKPQFEAGRKHVGKGGIVRDPVVQQMAVSRVAKAVEELGGANLEFIESPILGAEGNREFLLHARFC